MLISTITFSAKIAKLAELPTEVVGIMPPSSVIAIASMTATSGRLSCWLRICSTVSDKCWSINMTSPLLIARRKVLSTWNGMRRDKTPASVSCLSKSLPKLAPVINVIFNGFFFASSTSACGTALASPARVKPLIPTVIPFSMNCAACSALMTLS
ncbi:Uncharacterised protein [Acinetobacter baumannii]|nr:Uncharacterised protein [Acinetobacter baumannii]